MSSHNNVKNGQQGNRKGGYQVPAPGDTAHRFVKPVPGIRGPCPGLNAATYHNFLAHDGITINRVTPYSDIDIGAEIIAQYLEYPVLFGGATGGGTFDLLLDFGYIKNGSLAVPQAANVACLLYQLVGERLPSGLNTILAPMLDVLNFMTSKIATSLENLGYPSPLT